jgi:hypothetical protein
MRALADALVYAATYINCRAASEDDDGDVEALESIAGSLHEATPAEEDELAAAAERALAEEVASKTPRPDFVRGYATWMEDVIGEGWQQNRRVTMG